jgi:hypothetical protein
LDHLEKQAKEFKDREDLVPYTGEKRGIGQCCSYEHVIPWASLRAACVPGVLPCFPHQEDRTIPTPKALMRGVELVSLEVD